jgi:uncharacterized membrane protein
MTFNMIIGFLSPLALLFIGLMLRFSSNESWRSYNKYWIWFIIIGSLLLAFKVYKYLM